VNTGNGGMLSKTLHFPGDLDWWWSQHSVGVWATARSPRIDRHGLLPMLKGIKDWKEGIPPAFPQNEFWAKCLAFNTPTTVINVVEIDLGRAVPVKSLTISSLGVDPALGLVAVSAEEEKGQEFLQGTEWMPPTRFREPRTIFNFTKVGDTLGWKTEGEAFSVAPVANLFSFTTLNSLAAHGELATGRAISPDFEIGPDETYLEIQCHGGNSLAENGPGALYLELIDSATGESLHKIRPFGSHELRYTRIPVADWRGRRVRLEMVDESTESGYAWLGLREVKLAAE
jgi:hypothetical protein